MDRNLLERVIKRLEEKDLVDHEVMDADDLGALRYEIAELKKLRENDELSKYNVTVKYIEVFKPTVCANSTQHAKDLACHLFTCGELDVVEHHLEVTID